MLKMRFKWTKKSKTEPSTENEICVETIFDFYKQKLVIKKIKHKHQVCTGYRFGKPIAEASTPRPVIVKSCVMSV